mgnify:FL=1
MTSQIITGHCLESLRRLPDESIHCVVTSPPYWGLRDYGVDGQIGLEPTFDGFLDRLVAVFEEVRRVLRKDGTCWVNMGDSYVASGSGQQGAGGPKVNSQTIPNKLRCAELRPKNLMGQPWRLAFALQAEGWYLRQDIIWHKPAPMPESCKDRCTKAHEYLFLLTKSERYFWNHDAMQEPVTGNAHARVKSPSGWETDTGVSHSAIARQSEGVHPKAKQASGSGSRQNESFVQATSAKLVATRNRRSVWTIPAEPQSEAHFATFPTALVRPCILAGCPPGGTVLDPFGGSGTTGVVALEAGRHAILLELNPEYAKIAASRLMTVTIGFKL